LGGSISVHNFHGARFTSAVLSPAFRFFSALWAGSYFLSFKIYAMRLSVALNAKRLPIVYVQSKFRE
jgi:hypothetical protein